MFNLKDQISSYLTYLLCRGLSSSWIKSCKRILGEMSKCTHKEMAEPLLFEKYIRKSIREGTPQGYSRRLTVVRSFAKFLISEGILGEDPTLRFLHPKLPRRLPKALPYYSIKKFLRVAVSNVRDGALFELLYGTGVRASELCSLNIGDVDIEQRLIKVFGKGSKERIVIFNANCKKKLNRYLRARGSYSLIDPLFLSDSGKRMTKETLWSLTKKYSKRAGIYGRLTPHVLRHSFATHLLDNDAGIEIIQELLGHSSISTTQIYLSISKNRIKEVYMRCHPRANLEQEGGDRR